MVRQRLRLRFCKQEAMRFLGHRDLMRCLERLFRRAGLPLGFSQGFHPKPRMTFPSALPVGVAGAEEVMELELAEELSAAELLLRLATHVLPGLAVRSVEVLAPRSKKARLQSARYQIPVPPPYDAGVCARIDALRAAPACPIRRPRGGRSVDLRPLLEDVSFHDGVLHLRLRVDPAGGAGPRDLLAVLGLAELEQHGACLTRTAVELEYCHCSAK